MTDRIDTIEITADELRARGVRITDYVREVVTCGDEPGVLSGAALQGKAAQYGSSYARTRAKVARAVSEITAAHGRRVIDGFELTANRRWARVWCDDSGPVRLVLAEEPAASAA